MSATPAALLAIDRGIELLNFRGARASADELATARVAVAELIDATRGLRSYEYRRGDLIHQTSLGDKCKCVTCIETRADAALVRTKGGVA